MDIKSIVEKMYPATKKQLMLVFITTIIAIFINLSGIFPEFKFLLSGIFFFPLIISASFFPRKCYPFLVFLSLMYFISVPDFAQGTDISKNFLKISGAFSFLFVGFLVSYLSSNLRHSENLLNDIIESLPDATFIIDKSGTVTAWNKAAEKLTNVKKSEIIGKNNYEHSLVIYGDRIPMLVDYIVSEEKGIEKQYPDYKNEDGRYSAEVRIPHFRDQSGIYLNLSSVAVKDESGKKIAGIESMRDITDIIMTESALSNTSKKLNTLSGIIRTDLSKKLAVLYGTLRLGTLRFNDPDVISFIEEVKKSADGIERQLGISRGFRAIGTKPPTWISVQNAANEAAEKVDLKKIYFKPWTERLEVFADPNFSKALYHLIDNSANLAGDVTKIIITYQLSPDGCTLIYEDNGPGIPETDKEELLKRDSDESYGRGLFLMQDIISITKISIKETGIPGKGARFELSIPSEGYRII